MTIKQFVEEMTDQRIPNVAHHYKILQHSLAVTLLRKPSAGIIKQFNNKGEMTFFHELPRPAIIIITNTPY